MFGSAVVKPIRQDEEACSDTSVCTDEEPLMISHKEDTRNSKRREICGAVVLTVLCMGLITFLVPKWYVRTYTYNLHKDILKGEYQCDYWGRNDDQFDRADLATMRNRYESGAVVLLEGTCTKSRKFTLPISTSSASITWIEEELQGKAESDYASYVTHKLVATATNTVLMTFLCPDNYDVEGCEPCTVVQNSICSADFDDASILDGF